MIMPSGVARKSWRLIDIHQFNTVTDLPCVGQWKQSHAESKCHIDFTTHYIMRCCTYVLSAGLSMGQ